MPNADATMRLFEHDMYGHFQCSMAVHGKHSLAPMQSEPLAAKTNGNDDPELAPKE